MKLSLLSETKPYSEMTASERSKTRKYRAEKYEEARSEKGRDASGSNETNKRTTAEWRSKNPDKAAKVNTVNYRVRKGELPPVKPGKQRHHYSYEGEEGGRFLSVNGALNAKKANQKRAQQDKDS